MVSIEIILFSGLVFNIFLVAMIVFFVRKSREKLSEQAQMRRQQMLEQGKIITAQENLLKSKQDLLKEKDSLLGKYRRNLD
jgi:large-conductance mechanosensitive channel